MKLVSTKAVAVLVVATMLPLLIAVKEPVSFQKLNAISEVSIVNELEGINVFDIEDLISGVPYNKNATSQPFSFPKDRFEQSLEQGIENCADFSFGAAFWLRSKQIDYEVVHFLPGDNFLEGQGHTVVRSSYELDGKTGWAN